MRVLLDECVPRALGKYLAGHEWSTVPREGFGGFKNGKLLRAIEGSWDVLLTTDANLPYQQAISRLGIAVLILRARSNDIAGLHPWVSEILRVLPQLEAGTATLIGDPDLISRGG